MMVPVECEMLMRWSDKDVLQAFTSIRLEFKRDIWAKGMDVGNIHIHIQNKRGEDQKESWSDRSHFLPNLVLLI